jgi:hypothetical protein
MWCRTGGFHTAGAEWLGWDSAAGAPVPHPPVPGLPDAAEVLTRTPRKYGFHGTVKPPFFLADGTISTDAPPRGGAFCAHARR